MHLLQSPDATSRIAGILLVQAKYMIGATYGHRIFYGECVKQIIFEGEPLRANLGEFAPKAGTPFVYFLTELQSKAPFYIGEYGRATTYNVVERIMRHFGTTGNLCRVATNLQALQRRIPTSFAAFIKPLSDDFRDPERRKNLEAWIIQLVCHDKKIQSANFCVVRYQAPTTNESKYAARIVDEFIRA